MVVLNVVSMELQVPIALTSEDALPLLDGLVQLMEQGQGMMGCLLLVLLSLSLVLLPGVGFLQNGRKAPSAGRTDPVRLDVHAQLDLHTVEAPPSLHAGYLVHQLPPTLVLACLSAEAALLDHQLRLCACV